VCIERTQHFFSAKRLDLDRNRADAAAFLQFPQKTQTIFKSRPVADDLVLMFAP
jgi:hypothetical protein